MTSTAIFLTGIALGVFSTVFAIAMMLAYFGYKMKQTDEITDERRCDL